MPSQGGLQKPSAKEGKQHDLSLAAPEKHTIARLN
jgi:hypothetical protein